MANRNWQGIAVELAKKFLANGSVGRSDLENLIGEVSAGDKQQLAGWRRKFALEAERGFVARKGGQDGPTLTGKALTPRQRKSAAVCRDALAEVSKGFGIGQGRGRKVSAVDLGDLVDDVEFDDDDDSPESGE